MTKTLHTLATLRQLATEYALECTIVLNDGSITIALATGEAESAECIEDASAIIRAYAALERAKRAGKGLT